MKSFTMTFTVKEWRRIASACAVKSLKAKPEDKLPLRDIAHRIADETGKYDADGEPLK